MTASADWTVAPDRPTLKRDEVAVWRLPSDYPRPLETVLARYLGVEPSSLTLERTPLGKPELRGAPLRFNLAHSGEVALVAVALGRAVGVDVERMRPGADRWALVRHALTARERGELDALPPGRRARAFLSVWARKEALLKAAGVGLGVDPTLVAFDGESLIAVPSELGQTSDWAILDIPLSEHVAAIAVAGGSRSFLLTCLLG